LILPDIMMPSMDGYEVCRRFKKNEDTKDIPLIALTASAMTNEREKINDAVFDCYVPKPIDIEEFIETINDYLLR